MIYLIKCESTSGVRVNSLGVSLSLGQTMDCQKAVYENNKEVQVLVSTGLLSMTVKASSTRLNARSGLPKANPRRQAPQVIERVIERVVERESSPDMEQLTQNLLAQLGSLLSPELLAKAIAKQIPTQQVTVSQPTDSVSGSQFTTSAGDELTFIPSKIISEDLVSSSKSTVAESNGSDDNLTDALKALKAMRKAQK